MDPLTSTDRVAALLGATDLHVLDASWHLPAEGRDAQADYRDAHLHGAQFFDIDAISDPDSDLSHMLPTPERFAAAMGALGIGDGDRVVVYDTAGLFSAARAWWMLRAMGLRDVTVMDGGLPRWLAEGRPVTAEAAPARPATFHADPHQGLVADGDAVADASLNGTAQIVDARAPERFAGHVPEPRPGLRAGHIPGSVNLPYKDLLNADGTMKDAHALGAAFEAAGVDPARPVITTCGSGITAAVLALALARLGHPDHALYDGSWADWGREGGRPVGILPS